MILLKEAKRNAAKMSVELGLSNSFMTDMKRRDAMPSAENLGRIADYLDVSFDYLLGRTDIPEVNK